MLLITVISGFDALRASPRTVSEAHRGALACGGAYTLSIGFTALGSLRAILNGESVVFGEGR